MKTTLIGASAFVLAWMAVSSIYAQSWCASVEEKMDRVEKMIYGRYGDDSALGGLSLLPVEGNEEQIEVWLSSEDRFCEFVVQVTDDCEVEVVVEQTTPCPKP